MIFDVVFKDSGYAVFQVGKGYRPFRVAWFRSREEAVAYRDRARAAA